MNILAHLAYQFARSPEDIATEGLLKILSESSVAGTAINGLLSAWGAHVKVQDWKSQVTADDGSRTDIEGYAHGELVVILENKFWAGLTDNQPNTYLRRLPDGGVLTFVAPERRRESLEFDLEKRCEQNIRFENGRAILHNGKKLIVTSWEVILAAIEGQLRTVIGEEAIFSDCQQLIGLAQHFGREGFLPFTTSELTGDTPRVILQLIDVIDDAINSLVNRGANIKGYKASATAKGYTRYFDMSGLGCQLDLNLALWREYGRSPIWLRIAKMRSPSDWNWDIALREFLPTSKSSFAIENPKYMNPGLWQAIRVLEGCTRDQIVSDIVSQIQEILAKGSRGYSLHDFKSNITTTAAWVSEREASLLEPVV